MVLFRRKLLHLNHTQNSNVTTTKTNSIATSISTGGDIVTLSSLSSSSSSSSSASENFGEERVRDIHEGNSYSPTCCFNSFRLNPPFDSAMALTVLVLITALFFMGFFSIYIRRFADEDSVDPRRRRSRRGTRVTAHLPPMKKGDKGVDPRVIESLPTYLYVGRDLEEGEEEEKKECAICLGEFENRDKVKNIPLCGHVFHLTCIDTWLSSRVTCPLCRTAEFFPAVSAEKDVAISDTSVSAHVLEGRRDTCREREGEVGPTCVRRTSSWSWDGERVALHRSLSF